MIGEIKERIEEQVDKGKEKFVIFPYGEIGMKVHDALDKVYGVEPIILYASIIRK